MAMNGVGCQDRPHYGALASNTIFRHFLKTQAAVGNLARSHSRAVTIVCAEMDEQWGYVRG